jgi:hypothetical protein
MLTFAYLCWFLMVFKPLRFLMLPMGFAAILVMPWVYPRSNDGELLNKMTTECVNRYVKKKSEMFTPYEVIDRCVKQSQEKIARGITK